MAPHSLPSRPPAYELALAKHERCHEQTIQSSARITAPRGGPGLIAHARSARCDAPPTRRRAYMLTSEPGGRARGSVVDARVGGAVVAAGTGRHAAALEVAVGHRARDRPLARGRSGAADGARASTARYGAARRGAGADDCAGRPAARHLDAARRLARAEDVALGGFGAVEVRAGTVSAGDRARDALRAHDRSAALRGAAVDGAPSVDARSTRRRARARAKVSARVDATIMRRVARGRVAGVDTRIVAELGATRAAREHKGSRYDPPAPKAKHASELRTLHGCSHL